MKSVVLCGSRRFKAEIRAFAAELRLKGVMVYEPFLHQGADEWDHMSDVYKRFVAMGLTHDHFYKIAMADAVYILNKDGYAGVSTTLEIGYAVGRNKPIYAYSADGELCRHILFRKIVITPLDLMVELGLV